MQRKLLLGYCIVNGIIVIDSNSQTVRRIFIDYVAGLSICGVANQLSKEGVLNASNHIKWTHSYVSHILQNKKYLGDQFFPQIISEDLFEQAEKRRIAVNERRGGTGNIRLIKYPFSRKVKCAKCGAFYNRTSKHGRQYWKCSNGRGSNSVKCCNISLTELQLEDAFNQLLRRLIRDNSLYQVSKQVGKARHCIGESTELQHINMQIDEKRKSGADSEEILELLYERFSEQYKLLRISDMEEQTVNIDKALKGVLENREIEFCIEAFKEIVAVIIVHEDKRLVFQLVNGVELE